MEKNILVVDDNAPNRSFVVDCLMKADLSYKVFSAPNGQIALQLTEELKVHLILLDWEMPVMNGIETLTELKKQASTKNIPVIMYTGIMTASANLKEALELGAIDFLRKPVDPVELVARIQSILKLKQMEQEKIEMNARELTAATLQIAQKNNFLCSLNIDLEQIKQKNEASRADILKLQRSIHRAIEDEHQWEIIKKRINGVYLGFFNRLLEQHPNLTKGEVRLAALLKINLTNKEIASILNISPKGLEKSRSRLRKKLALSSTDSMEHYILAI